MATKKTGSSTARNSATATARTRPTKSKAAKSTTAKTIAAKTTTSPATAPAAKAPVARAPVQGVTSADAAPARVLTKKELFARLKARTPGVKGSDTRQVMEAMLDVLGEALVSGLSIKAQPLGMVKVQRQKTADGADMLVLKLRRKKQNPDGKDPLAEAAE